MKSKMSPSEFNLHISKINASYHDRKYGADIVNTYPELLTVLLKKGLDEKDKKHFKALWVLEFYTRTKVQSLQKSISFILYHIPKIKHDSGVRPLAKILQYCLIEFDKNNFSLTPKQTEIIIETCFDWLISNQKVAVKGYAMKNLYILGKKIKWVYPELSTIIEKDQYLHSTYYKITANKILKAIAKM